MVFQMPAQQSLSLEDMSAFRPQAGNWQVVGEVEMNPFGEVVDQSRNTRKGRKRRKRANKTPILDSNSTVVSKPGTGILLNRNTDEMNDALLTNWEHGDLLLEFEVMIPEGSNSGIYLQGRYELQLRDSWGVRYPRFSDMGGIYSNHYEEPELRFEGIAPSVNACRAPGLWQKMKIHFRAPRFSDQGEKIENARFVRVELNGVVIHQNVEVPRATGGPISELESSKGPLMIQGDHGAVAFRNIQYTLLEPLDMGLTDLSYQVYHGEFQGLSDLAGLEPNYIGETEKLDVGISGKEDQFGVVFEGYLEVSESWDYTFSLGFTGGARFIINGRTVVEYDSSEDHGVFSNTVKLEKARYPIRVENVKRVGWMSPGLALWVETETSERLALHAPASYAARSRPSPLISVEPQAEPRLLRGFVRYGGDGDKRSHTMAVGTPEGVHYVYDLNKGQAIGLWRGPFVDASPMWRSRGDGSFQLSGDVCWTFQGQALLAPGDDPREFEDKHRHPDFQPSGYRIDPDTRLPVYTYAYKDYRVEHRVVPSADGKSIVQEVTFETDSPVEPAGGDPIIRTDTSFVYKLAQGPVKSLGNHTYRVGDSYFIRILEGPQAFERITELGGELCIPVDGSSLKFEIIW